MKIRKAKREDLAAVSKLAKRVFDRFVAKDFTIEGIKKVHKDISLANFKKRMDEGDLILIAIQDDKIVGCIEEDRGFHIRHLYVDGRFQKSGIGSKLVQRMITFLRKTSSYIDLYSALDSIDFYKKLGFHKAGKKRTKGGLVVIPMKITLIS